MLSDFICTNWEKVRLALNSTSACVKTVHVGIRERSSKSNDLLLSTRIVIFLLCRTLIKHIWPKMQFCPCLLNLVWLQDIYRPGGIMVYHSSRVWSRSQVTICASHAVHVSARFPKTSLWCRQVDCAKLLLAVNVAAWNPIRVFRIKGLLKISERLLPSQHFRWLAFTPPSSELHLTS